METQESEGTGITTLASDGAASNGAATDGKRTSTLSADGASDGPSVEPSDGAVSENQSTRTIASGGLAGAEIAADDPPIASWGRFELLEPLGAGAMGKVYKARDRRVDRIVAIKFVVGADPRAWMRFRTEAKALARIIHPNVCRLYEVDEVGGRPYIAMQLVDGKPLREAAAEMSPADRIAAIRDAALAIQEVHHQGVVHRDITPANVMVERRGDRWVAIVMDFGLARETTADLRLTQSGMVLGTPAYMSPEQARGDIHAIDRRTDIYGLGATLYEAMTGRPPFAGKSRTALLAQVIHDDPVAPRHVVAGLPIDLEIISLKCLAKEPAQRYASAQELADDLDRYLAGESILGRRPSLWQRLRRSARRHRSLVMLGAVSLAAVAIVGALGARAWLVSRTERARATERTILAERLGRDAKDIELFMRSAYQLPLQDVRPMRDRVRSRMQAIAATRHDLGALGDAVVHDALGRGHLALHQWQEAVDELARVTEIGPVTTPEVHAARGRALGELFHRALEDARRSGDRKWLAQRRQDLERQYLKPALVELAASRASEPRDGLAGDDTDYLEVLIALYRGEFGTAESAALAAANKAPWRFELYKLAGDAAYSAALTEFDRGGYDAARTALGRAESLYAQASQIARSDASVYLASAQAALQRAEIDARQNRSTRDALDRALEEIENALGADPDDARAYTTEAYILLRRLRTLELHQADDERALLERIAEAAQRAVDHDSRDAGAWDALGNAHVFRGSYELYHGGDGGPWWQRALDDFHTALAIRPNDPWPNNDLGAAHRWIGASLDQNGRDPVPAYRAALRAYEKAVQLDHDYVFAWSNQADLHATIAEHDASSGSDPRAEANAALRAGAECRTIDRSFGGVLDSMARAQLALASYLLDTGGDPRAPLAEAQNLLDPGETRSADNPTFLFHRLEAAWLEGELRLRDGADPRAPLAAGRVALTRLLQLHQDSADVQVEAARLDLVEARWAARASNDAAALLASATAHAEQAKNLDGRFADTYLVATQVCVERARHSREALAHCRNDAQQALDINPQLIKAQRLRTELDQLLQP